MDWLKGAKWRKWDMHVHVPASTILLVIGTSSSSSLDMRIAMSLASMTTFL